MTQGPADRGLVRVLIVDDDALVRAGLRMMLGGADRIEIVGEVADGSEVLSALDRHRADVILMDLRMPKVDGITAMELVRQQSQPPAVLVLTTFDRRPGTARAASRRSRVPRQGHVASGDRPCNRAGRSRREHALARRHAAADRSSRQ